MSNKKNSNVVVAYNLAGKFVLNGINFFVVSVFVRLLGTENFGLFSLYLTWESIVLILVGLQTQSIIGNISIKYTKDERFKYLSSNVCFCTIVAIFLLFLLFLFRNVVSLFMGLPVPILFFMLLHAYTAYGANVVLGVWGFDLEAKRNFWVSLLLSIINIGLSILLILMITDYHQKYIGRIVGSAIPYIIFGGGCILYLLHKGRTYYNRSYLKFTLYFSIPIVFHALSNIVLSQSDRVMLQKMGTLHDVGVYSVIFTLNNLLIILMEAFNSAWVPYFYEDLKNKRFVEIKTKSHNYIWLFVSITMAFMLISPEVLKFYGGAEFSDSLKAIPFLSVGSFFVFLYSFPVNFKYYKGETKSIAVGTIATGLINVLLNMWFIPKYGIYGASFSTALSYILLWFFHHQGAKKLGMCEYPYKTIVFLKPSVFILITALLSFTVLYDFYVIRWGLAMLIGSYTLVTIYRRKQIW